MGFRMSTGGGLMEGFDKRFAKDKKEEERIKSSAGRTDLRI